jgi:hypothetical protein
MGNPNFRADCSLHFGWDDFDVFLIGFAESKGSRTKWVNPIFRPNLCHLYVHSASFCPPEGSVCSVGRDGIHIESLALTAAKNQRQTPRQAPIVVINLNPLPIHGQHPP